ncbi:MAG: uroporphyrinogen-III C-methyltransferase [Candidatus Eremiobacterota bacterium]
MKGKVYLIGAGPGDPDLITVKGKKILEEADCIVYDRLANPELLALRKNGAELIYAGKEPGVESQSKINKILVKKGCEGKKVARLKGGDPFVFGRGGEECEILSEHNIPFEVIPGITSAIAVPACAGIAVTHREHNTCFSIITGHEDPNKEFSSIDWACLGSGKDPLVFLMGMERLEDIAGKLIAHGRPSDTPVAVIYRGTTPLQRTLVSTLAHVAEEAKKQNFRPPCIIITGSVVKLREKIKWFEKRPLFGKRIVVTRARAQAGEMSQKLRELGAYVIECPVIKIIPPESYEDLDRAIQKINTYDWLIFTSQNGVKHFMDRLFMAGKDVRILSGAKICSIGPATAKELRNYGLVTDYMPPKFVAEELLAHFPELKENSKILLPRAKEARDLIAEEFGRRGIAVDTVTAYETDSETVIEEEQEEIKKELQENIDLVTFTSSSTVKNFVNIIEKLGIKKNCFPVVAAIGPVTAKTAEEHGFNVEIRASEYTIDGLVAEILKYYNREE